MVRSPAVLVASIGCFLWANGIPAPSESALAQSIDVSGNWSSNAGPVEFRQQGNRVAGTLQFSNGAVATISGTLQGSTLSFRWSISLESYGDGTLTTAADGRSMTGRYTDRALGTVGVFNLTRRTAATVEVQRGIMGRNVEEDRPQPDRMSPEEILRLIPGLLPREPQANPQDNGRRYNLQQEFPILRDPGDFDEKRPRPPRVVPTPHDLSQLSKDQLQSFVHGAVQEFDADLSGLSTGDNWKAYLQTNELSRILVGEEAVPPNSAWRERLTAVAKRFDEVSQHSKYRQISELWSFRALHVALTEKSMEPAERTRRQLATNSSALAVSLDRFPGGDGWKRYLQLDQLGRALESDDLHTVNFEQLRTIAGRFDAVSRNPDFRVVAGAVGFQATRQSLDIFINQFRPDLAAESIVSTVQNLRNVYLVRVHAVQVADDDGQRAAAISPDEVKQWIDYANTVFDAAEIEFQFNPDKNGPDWSTLHSTLINNMMGDGDKNWPQARDAAHQFAGKYKDKAVVFFRYGYGFKEKKFNVPCLRLAPGWPPDVKQESKEVTIDVPDYTQAAGGGFSWTDYNFVIMPGFGVTRVCGHQNISLLAHELGHYLGLPHTFRTDFKSLTDAEGYVTAQTDKSHYDGDGLSDTPADPGLHFQPVQCSASTSETIASVEFTLPRDNIMSYYDSATKTLTPQQVVRIHDVLTNHDHRRYLRSPQKTFLGELVTIGQVRNVGGVAHSGKRTATLSVATDGKTTLLATADITDLAPGKMVQLIAPTPSVTNESTRFTLAISPGDENPQNDKYESVPRQPEIVR